MSPKRYKILTELALMVWHGHFVSGNDLVTIFSASSSLICAWVTQRLLDLGNFHLGFSC